MSRTRVVPVLGQRGVHVDVQEIQPVMLGHAQDLEAAHQLGFSDLSHGRGRPALLVHRTTLAARGRNADHASPVTHRLRHQSGGEIGLIVGVRPDPQDRSEPVHPIDLRFRSGHGSGLRSARRGVVLLDHEPDPDQTGRAARRRRRTWSAIRSFRWRWKSARRMHGGQSSRCRCRSDPRSVSISPSKKRSISRSVSLTVGSLRHPSTNPRSFAVSHNALSRAFLPLCRRDITVPIGVCMMSAISL